MIQVVNKNGEPIKGLFRTSDGSLTVNDPSAYTKAMVENKRDKEFDEIKDKVNKMENMMQAIYNKLFLD